MPFDRRVLCIGALGSMAVTILASVWLTKAVKAQTEAPMLPTMSPARALAFLQAAERHLDYVPGEVLVKFKDGVTSTGQQRALDALRSRPVVDELHWMGDVALFTDQTESDATILAAQLSAQPEVVYAEPNYLRRLKSVPNDPSYATAQWNLKALDLPRTWDINPGGSNNVIVAVLDSGITTVNQSMTTATWNGLAIQTISVPFRVNTDLAGGRLVSPHDFVTGGGSAVWDTEGHGTHVSSTLGEDTNNGIAEAGIAYNVQIMPVKVCTSFWDEQFAASVSGLRGYVPLDAGGCPSDAVASGLRYAADNGAKVINLSLGGGLPSTMERDALIYAVSKGAFVAISAGNGFEDNHNAIEYPAGFAPGMDGVMAVGAVGRSLKHAYYSTTGPQVEIAAPGGDLDDGGLDGLIWQGALCMANFEPEYRQFLGVAPLLVIPPRFDQYCETALQGTSMASPHVAGVAALIISQGVTNPAAVEQLIKATARDLGAPGRDDVFGYGLIQPRAAVLGYGVTR